MITILLSLLFFLNSSKLYLFFNSFFNLNNMSMFLGLMCLFSLFMTLNFLFPFLTKNEKKIFFFFFFLIEYMIFFSFMVENIFFFLLLFETVLFPMLFLIYNFSKGSDKILAVVFMIFFNLSGSIPFMIFSMKSSNLLNSFSVTDNLEYLSFSSIFLFFCFVLIFLTKIPIIFFHFWLPKAHGSASGTCSMVLASLVLKLGTFGILKFGSLLTKNFLKVNSFFFSLGSLSSILFVFFMYRYFDLKYLVACSSILHMSMITPSVMLYNSLSTFMALLMMVGHGLVSFYLFYLVTLIYEGTQSRNSSINKSDESLCKTLSFMIFLVMFFNLGVPPLINFFSEMGFCAMIAEFSYSLTILFGASMLVSIFFTILICSSILFGKKFFMSESKIFMMDLISFLKLTIFLVLTPLVFFSFSLMSKHYFVVVKI